MNTIHNCPCCTCNQYKLSWYDQVVWVFPNDYHKLASVIVDAALSRFWQRGPRGNCLPTGLDSFINSTTRQKLNQFLISQLIQWNSWNYSILLDQIEQTKKATQEWLATHLSQSS